VQWQGGVSSGDTLKATETPPYPPREGIALAFAFYIILNNRTHPSPLSRGESRIALKSLNPINPGSDKFPLQKKMPCSNEQGVF
jgi:hypothetical protein